MTSATTELERPIKNHGWRVAFAGMGINLALGILYTWSVISKGIPDSWEWTQTDRSWPYAIACLVFSIIMEFRSLEIIVVSDLEGLDETFLLTADSLDEAMEMAEARVGEPSSVGVIHDARRLLIP